MVTHERNARCVQSRWNTHVAEDSHHDDPSQQGGVFGNLPDARPGKRSPRRSSGKDSAPATRARSAPVQAKKASRAGNGAKGTPSAPKRAAEPNRRSSAPKGQAAGTPQPRPPGARAEGAGGIEDLAWAGVAAAAEAATLGVRLASRALDALRGSPERE